MMIKSTASLLGEQIEGGALQYQPLLLDVLNRLSDGFEPDELAYLALTSKPEFVIRDATAFQLYRQLTPKGLLVAREWRHSDIAILENDAPAAIVELKSILRVLPLPALSMLVVLLAYKFMWISFYMGRFAASRNTRTGFMY